MNTRRCIFTILFAVLVSQGNIFAAEQDSNEPEELAQFAEDDKWSEPNDGLVTQLIPQNEYYILGKPMEFGLVLKNISDSEKKYDPQRAIGMHSLIVKTADNSRVYYKAGPYQTSGGPRPIESGEVVTLFENRDISDEFAITKPGKYTVQFRGFYRLPASNVIEFEVKTRGTPDERDVLIDQVIDVLPDANWLAMAPKRFRHAPAGRKEETISIILRHLGGEKGGDVLVFLWKTNSPMDVTEEKEEDTPTSDYLGKNASGYFYIETPPKALDYWPKMKEDIAKTLKLDRPGNSNY
ncbi:MAG: hypothetical protein PHY02_01860 [Phycisphaerae bacterium]|nr:hypothetical protein [Phycisphaerae bacterium]